MFETSLGFFTCAAYVIAFAKLQQLMPTKVIVFSSSCLWTGVPLERLSRLESL